MNLIEPITRVQKEEVVAETLRYIQHASELFDDYFAAIPVVFDLRGRAAGMYKVKHGDDGKPQKMIRYNPYLFAKYYMENFSTTIPHEVAHYVVHSLYGSRYIRPHGKEWCNVMLAFGQQAMRTAKFDMAGIPERRHKQYDYSCRCRLHRLTSRRHFKILRNRARYLCRDCGDVLRLVAS